MRETVGSRGRGGAGARITRGLWAASGAWLWVFGVLVGFAALGISDVAWAQDLQPINETAEYIQEFLTGRLATSVAVIAVAVVGYLWFFGQIATQAAMSVVAGIALVFGSAQIVAVLEAVAR